ncbi:MAG: sugar ABC transporter permease [Eubacteriales bacterium]|nr:sugar ABC transporter permease [Eubacteriales bacterium]
MKQSKGMIVAFLAPAVVAFLMMFLYPVTRTVIMSFFQVESVTAKTDAWQFAGFNNYVELWNSVTFRAAMKNIMLIWLIGGIVVLSLSLLFAVVLNSGIRGKSFFRALVYMPNIISAVALATMWKQFVFVNANYGLMKGIWKTLGMGNVNWLGTDMIFWAMLIAFCFGAVGYYMLIFLSGIDRIPADLFEAATIDGANKPRQFVHITMPLLMGTLKTNLTFWSISTITFFVWSKMFSPLNTDLTTVTPMVYMYDITFGTQGNVQRSAGGGAAVGVIMALMILLIFMAVNALIRDDGIEY